jgi:hypothetical protein
MEPCELPVVIAMRMVFVSFTTGLRRRPGGADFAADTELDAVGRWTARTICGYASLHHACASLSQDEVKREVNRVMPDYDLLSLILRGEAMAALDGCQVVGLTPTGDERDRLIPWLL